MSQRIFLQTLMAVVTAGLLSVGGGVSLVAAQGNSDWALAHATDVQERHTESLMAQAGVVGTAVGRNQQGVPVVKVYVETGAAAAGIPTALDDVSVSVQVSGPIVALKGPPGGSGNEVDPTARFDRPVPIGVSTGHPDITAGTIGCRVTDGTNVYALSNNHVYADENMANIDDAVIQPGTYDGGSSSADDIGNLADFEEIKFDGTDNTIDAAIASTTTALVDKATTSDCYGTPKSMTIDPAINMKVKKCGRTTGETKGTISGINATVDVGYSTGVARFVNQIIITPGSFSAGGDSGSLIVMDGKGQDKADDRKPVGLLFAGSQFLTVANPIGPVLDRFGVSIDGE